MKRFLLLVALLVGLSSCGVTRQSGPIDVEATVFCALYSGDAYSSPAPAVFGSYSRVGISESEAIRIFNSMTTYSQRSSISSATLHLRYIDNTNGALLAEEDWGILWDSTRSRFVGAVLTY